MDYSDHPRSVSEIRSDRSNKGSDWTPRDLLIALLRDIDSGERDVESIFIAASVRGADPGNCKPFFAVAAASPIEALGVVEVAKQAYIRAGYGE